MVSLGHDIIYFLPTPNCAPLCTPFLLLCHRSSVLLCCFIILAARDDSLKQFLCILILELILFVLVAQSVAEGKLVLEHTIASTFQTNLILYDDFQKLELLVKAE